MINQKEQPKWENINSVEFLYEFYRRIKNKEIVIEGRKWKSNCGGLGRKQVIIISEQSNPTKNFLLSFGKENYELYLEGNRII